MRINFFKNDIKIKSKLIIIFFIGLILRSYNINYEDFWIDEIVSFWSANPKYYGLEWILRLAKTDLHIFFNLLLKYYFSFFSYKIELARYFPLVISILTLISLLYLSLVLKIQNITLLFFLFTFNIYLIKFSQELRSYSLIVFLATITLIFFFKIVENSKFNRTYLIFFITSQIFLIITHVFGLLIFFAFLSFSLINFFKKNNNKFLIISNMIVGVFSIFFVIFYIKYFKLGVDWLPQLEKKFYTNFFFSKFFGSRLLGLFHLILLIYLIIKSKIILSKKCDPKIILILIIIISYLLPIIFNYSIKPILQDKYIIFVIIPILIITVDFLKYIENNIKKKIIIFFLYTITILNLFTETTVRQFFFDRPIHKPDLKSTFTEINKSIYKNYSFNLETGIWTDEKILNDVLKNYSDMFTNRMNMKLNYLAFTNDDEMIKNLNSDYLWLICLYDLNGKICPTPKNLKNSKTLMEKNFNSINLKLLKLYKNKVF